MDMSVLSLKNVSYKYEGAKKQVFKDVSIKFESGKMYAIMGKSGAGKSTLLSLISGLDLPTGGTLCYNENNLNTIDRDRYRSQHIGVIFQGYNLLLNATALENILLSMNISGNRDNDKHLQTEQLLNKVGIDIETAHRKILKLSGGEQQRIGIARALSHNPNIVIADEPTGNLDSDTEENIMQILQKLAHEEGKCVIVVTHSKQVAKYADELWGLNQSTLVFVK